MNQIPLAKLVLALAGVVLFFLGIRAGQDLLRWTGIALVTVAWLLRFVGRSAPREYSPTENAQSEDR